jgi:hypothetical protein
MNGRICFLNVCESNQIDVALKIVAQTVELMDVKDVFSNLVLVVGLQIGAFRASLHDYPNALLHR